MQDNIKESQNLEMSDSELSNLKRRQGKLRYLNITKDIPFKFTPPTVKNNSYKNIKSSKYFNSSDNYNNYKSTNDSNMVYSNNNHINTPQVNNPNVNSYNYQQQQQQRSMSGSYQNTYNSGNRFNKNFQYKNDRQPYNNIYNRAPQPQYQGTMNQGNNNKDDGTLSNTNLYIRNLTQETTDDSLKELCEKFGEIVSTKAIMDKQTNTCRGFGFVKFNNVEDAQKAMNGLSEQGLHVTQARVNKNGSEDNADSTNLYIANLPNGYTEDMLHALCANEGADVISTRILRDDAGESRCVGFARVESKERCEQIINKYNGKILEGTKEPLLVKLAATAKKNSKSRIYGNIHHINNYYLGQRNFSGMMRNSGMQGYPQNPIVAHPIAVENPYYNYPPPTGPMVDRQSNPNAHGMNRVSNTPHTTPRIPYPNLQAPHYPNASIPSGGPHYQVMAPGNHPQGYGTPQMMTTYQNSETPQVNQGPPSAEGTPNQVPQGYYQGYPFYQGQTYVQYGVDVQQMHLQQQQQQNNPQYSNGTANANVSRNEGDSQQYENAGVRGGQISNNNNKEKK
uniref:RRM domain-containing protein n=1 Tax=Parastrongyloides trichosuri TaxID=131310 RepID=A0A0N4Z2F7_PARTI